MFKTKILILGPMQAGKTTIANYLADAVENFVGDYRPTHGECNDDHFETWIAIDEHLSLPIFRCAHRRVRVKRSSAQRQEHRRRGRAVGL